MADASADHREIGMPQMLHFQALGEHLVRREDGRYVSGQGSLLRRHAASLISRRLAHWSLASTCGRTDGTGRLWSAAVRQ
ncbi:hypothetical protein GCM10025784_30160 [Citricoccus nitrophenolicus]